MMDYKKHIKEVFQEIAEGLETGSFGEKIKVGLTLVGSELDVEVLIKGAEDFQQKNPQVQVVLIGEACDTKLELHEVHSEEEQAKKMEELLDSGYIQGCVTRHYTFPMGVSTVGNIITPAMGKEMYLATTTGMSSPNRIQAMVMNTVAGIICAKAMGNDHPSVGIMNIEGARQVEKALRELNANGYAINFADSARSDGGVVMRGNDLLQGTPDIMIMDSLTGNILQKSFSSYNTGGNYESVGSGYGPGIGEGYERLVLILSRVSGTPVVSNALAYAARLVQGRVFDIAKQEYQKANDCGYKKIIESLAAPKESAQEEVKAPPEEIVTASIAGIDILELESAVQALWKEGIYATSGMGCTGPIVQVSDANLQKATDILIQAQFIAAQGDGKGC